MIARKPQFRRAIKASFSHVLLTGKSAGFGTLSSQSGFCARYLGRLSQDRRPFFFRLENSTSEHSKGPVHALSPSELREDKSALVWYMIIRSSFGITL